MATTPSQHSSRPPKSPSQPTIPDNSALSIQDTSNRSALPIRAKPPKSSPPHQTRRVIRLLEGDFAPGGSLCRLRALLPNPTSSFNHSRAL